MKITVNYGLTKNLGNYESERLDVSIERDLDKNENPEVVWTTEFARCKKFVRTALNLDYEPSEETNQQLEEILNRRGRRRNASGT